MKVEVPGRQKMTCMCRTDRLRGGAEPVRMLAGGMCVLHDDNGMWSAAATSPWACKCRNDQGRRHLTSGVPSAAMIQGCVAWHGKSGCTAVMISPLPTLLLVRTDGKCINRLTDLLS